MTLDVEMARPKDKHCCVTSHCRPCGDRADGARERDLFAAPPTHTLNLSTDVWHHLEPVQLMMELSEPRVVEVWRGTWAWKKSPPEKRAAAGGSSPHPNCATKMCVGPPRMEVWPLLSLSGLGMSRSSPTIAGCRSLKWDSQMLSSTEWLAKEMNQKG